MGGQIKHGCCGTPEHRAWLNMRHRCSNSHTPSYRWYGARGIIVCQRWDEFSNFLADVGYRPSPAHSLDRIDNNGNYEPGNCRWVTLDVQLSNRRPRSEWKRPAPHERTPIYGQDIVDKVRLLRAQGYTIERISKATGVSKSHSHRIATGAWPRRDNRKTLAKACPAYAK